MSVFQLGEEKEDLEAWVIQDMDRLLSDVWLSGDEDVFAQIFHLIMAENVSGKWIVLQCSSSSIATSVNLSFVM